MVSEWWVRSSLIRQKGPVSDKKETPAKRETPAGPKKSASKGTSKNPAKTDACQNLFCFKTRRPDSANKLKPNKGTTTRAL